MSRPDARSATLAASGRPAETLGIDLARAAFALACGLFLALLALTVYYYAGYAADAIRYPYELDYGEGIVWQQMDDLGAGVMYRPVHAPPHIVYHYTPLFHALAYGLSHAWGDALAAGRAIAVACTLLLVVFAGLATFTAAGRAAGRLPRLAGAVAGGLMVLSFAPLYEWSVLFRVDMMAVMFAALGLALFFASLERPRLLYLAGFAFVAAVYAKQSIVVTATACFLVSLQLRPALTLRVVAVCGAAGAALLAALVAVADGDVLRHLFLYNANPFRLDMLASNVARNLHEDMNLVALVLVPLGLFAYWRRLAADDGAKGVGFLVRLRTDRRAAVVATLGAHFAIGLVAGVGIGKWGASGNYFNEWFVGWAITIGLGVAALLRIVADAPRMRRPRVVTAVAAALVLAATLHVYVAGARWNRLPPPEEADAAQRVLGVMAGTPGRILADDMVLIRKAGKPVVIEPVIMTMLAGAGLWDETLFVERLGSGWFDLVVVRDGREELYSSAMWAAIHKAHPVAERIGRFTVFRPAAPR